MLFPYLLFTQDGIKPIIDVHLHGYIAEEYFVIPSGDGTMSPPTYNDFKNEIEAMMKKYNIVTAVKSGGEYDSELEKILLPGFEVYGKPILDTIEFKKQIEAGNIKVFGEIGAQYKGLTLAEPMYAPYLDLCEKYGIPVAIHTGGGPPGTAYRGNTKFRLTLGDPFLIEDVLIKHPKLKVYVMHAGGNYYDNLLSLMDHYKQVYCDLGIVLWGESLLPLWAEDFLRKAKKAGLIDRVMYGSDAMYWPHAIEKSINQLNSYDFLTEEDKRNIFYNNAYLFLGLGKEKN